MSSTCPRVAVSACLLGERVRYDGKEKRISWIADELARDVDVVSICPEVGAGMPVPRPPIQIVARAGESLRLVVVDEGTDQTASMQRFMHSEIERLVAEPIDGYIFKARSPSCGLRDTPRFASAAQGDSLSSVGAGLWAAALLQRWPDLPCVDESELVHAAGQADFLSRVRVYWQDRRSAA